MTSPRNFLGHPDPFSPRDLVVMLAIVILAALVVAAFAGCNSTAGDQFRHDVSGVGGNVSGNYDAATGDTQVDVGGTIYFRDPLATPMPIAKPKPRPKPKATPAPAATPALDRTLRVPPASEGPVIVMQSAP